MVNRNTEALDAVFSALSDPTRRAMLARLAEGEVTVTELAQPFAMSLPAASKHLRVLERAGLVERRVEGRVHHCRLRAEPLSTASDFLARYRVFWEGNLQRLAAYVEGRQAEPTAPGRGDDELERG